MILPVESAVSVSSALRLYPDSNLVVDLLNAECPSDLICHDVVVLSLTNLWKNGSSCRAVDSTAQIGLRYDSLCTPRLVTFSISVHLQFLTNVQVPSISLTLPPTWRISDSSSAM
jgi:hypothetical protein